jgi:hypothetical protein
MNEIVYNRLTDQLWLEDAPKFCEDEYYCPQLDYLDYIMDYSNHEFSSFRAIELVFDEWEVEQQEMFVDGLGNNHDGKTVTYDMVAKAYEELCKFAKEKNVCIITAQQGVKDFQPRILDSVSNVGIEYTPMTYKYMRHRT